MPSRLARSGASSVLAGLVSISIAYAALNESGLSGGKRALAVGCGPGYFAIPAAELVGPLGHVDAIDINPEAVRHIKRKFEERSLANVHVFLADAAWAGLPESSLDVVFLFGAVHSLGLAMTLAEMRRVLKAAARRGFVLRKSGKLYRFGKVKGADGRSQP